MKNAKESQLGQYQHREIGVAMHKAMKTQRYTITSRARPQQAKPRYPLLLPGSDPDQYRTPPSQTNLAKS